MHHLTPRAANLFAAALLCALLTSCKSHTQAETETHFLELCDGQCDEGLTCVCGACTDPCASDGDCAARSGVATCVGTPDACGSAVTSACDVECATKQDCGALGGAYECRAGRCRSAGALVVDASVPSTAGGGGAAGGAGSSGGVGGGSGVPDAGGAGSGGSCGSGGTSAGSGGSSGSGGAGAGGSGGSSGSGGTSAGSGGSSGSGGDAGVACDTVGATCCDPFPGDGVNYCEAGLSCVGDNTCQDCNCPLTGGPQVCGVDGLDYIAACGEACLPVAVACQGACPCQCVQDLATGCASTEPGGGTACCGGLVCCEGVPYDAAGECRTNCPFVSDRNAKTDIEPVDARAVLESVARLPIASWRYRTEPGARHVGPMAQDFAAELGLGADERVIAPVDASGVTLASIQALYAQVQALAQQNAELQRRLRQLEAAEAPVCR